MDSNWLKIEKDGDEVILKKCSQKAEGEIVIPKGVTEIGCDAFSGCSGLTSITIPISVTEISYNAFSGCRGLTSINIPASVKKIDSAAFEDCSGLTSIVVAQGNNKYDSRGNCNAIIETATNELVAGCKNTKIPDSVTEIGNSAFSGCSGLHSINIPNSVKCIGQNAFYGCSGLTSIDIPDSVTKIGNSAFSGCSGLPSINIPDSVTEIGDIAFSGCGGLASINIPASVTEIGRSVFSDCSGLTSIIVSQENGKYDSRGNCNAIIETATNELVSGCKNTEIPDSVTGIGFSAFLGCIGLPSINIPNSVKYIGQNAFYGCSGLTSIIVSQGNGKYDSRGNCNAIIETATNELVAGCKNTKIPDSVTEIGNSAFSGCSGLHSINIPNSVKCIGQNAFYGCSGLTSVTIPNSVTSIGNSAFQSCSGLTSVAIPNSVTSIGVQAFKNCSGLTSINIPDSVPEIGWSAFEDCSGLTSINIPNSVTNIDMSAFSGCSGLTSLTIGNGVTSIGNHAFSDCSGLTSINIPASVTEIGDNAFSGCSGLTSIVVVSGNGIYDSRDNCNAIIETATNRLIVGCSSTVIPCSVSRVNSIPFCKMGWYDKQPDGLLYLDGWCLGYKGNLPEGTLSIQEGIKGIADYAFYGDWSLDSIIIPNSITQIGYYAFEHCLSLKSVIIGNSVTEIGNHAFYGCFGIAKINIPASVTKIGGGAFSGCRGLTSIDIPASVTKIDDYVFDDCCGLTSVTIPDSVTSIGYSAFRGCCSLEGIVIPKSVTSIGDYAFCEDGWRDRGVLDYVLIGNPLIIIGENTFGGNNNFKPWVQIEEIPTGCHALYCKNDISYMHIPANVKKIVSPKDSPNVSISVLDIPCKMPETDGLVFAKCYISELRINTPRKQTIIPNDIKSALNNRPRNGMFGTVVYAVPELCEEESPVSGYIRATLARNDELVDINTKYILSVEPVELDYYHPHTGSRIRCAVCGSETHYDYIVYEPCDMVLKKIEHSLCQLSKRVGGIAGLLNQIETLANDKCSNK